MEENNIQEKGKKIICKKKGRKQYARKMEENTF